MAMFGKLVHPLVGTAAVTRVMPTPFARARQGAAPNGGPAPRLESLGPLRYFKAAIFLPSSSNSFTQLGELRASLSVFAFSAGVRSASTGASALLTSICRMGRS